MRYSATTDLPVSCEEAFAYHERPGCLSRLIPPWEKVEVEKSDHSLTEGSRVILRTRIFGVSVRWVAEHTRYEPPHLFADRQVSGPFHSWQHEHRFSGDGGACQLTDHIQFELPGGRLGAKFGSGTAMQRIESMFAYRHRVTRDDLHLASRYRLTPKTIAVSGSGGLIGSKLCSLLTLLGHRVKRIVRSPTDDADCLAVWSSDHDAKQLETADAVIHLAGKPIAGKRWTPEIKAQIRDSRVVKTRQLTEILASLDRKPSVLISASATGFYGDRGDQLLDENAAPADEFLADVAQQWETACLPAAEAGIRVVHPRFGIVLSPSGGALQQMLLPAKALGGRLGGGEQWWSWICLDDVLGGIYHAIATDELAGPVNFVAPEAVRNREFAKILGRVLGRPALVPAPAAALRAALGEMADALLLASTRVAPQRLIDTGYQYRFVDLERCLRYLLGVERLESSK